MPLRRKRQPERTAGPSLAVEASTGERYEDPSEDLLFELVSDLADQGYLIVERPADASGQTYAQVMRTPTGYIVERRDGSEDSHASATSPDLRAVHADLTTWAFAVDRPFGLPWASGYSG